MKINLKRCPFCGSQAELYFPDRGGVSVRCRKCLNGTSIHTDSTSESNALLSAVENWNRRCPEEDENLWKKFCKIFHKKTKNEAERITYWADGACHGVFCSKCNFSFRNGFKPEFWNYCPNCGAKMVKNRVINMRKGEEEDDDN